MSTFAIVSVKDEYKHIVEEIFGLHFELELCDNSSAQNVFGKGWKSFYITRNGTSEKILLFKKMGVKKTSKTFNEITSNFTILKDSILKTCGIAHSVKLLCFIATSALNDEVIEIKTIKKVVVQEDSMDFIQFVEYCELYHFVCY